MPFRPCCSRVGPLPDPNLCCSCVGRSSPASRRACTPDPAPAHRHARPRPEDRLPPATRWPAGHPVTPAARPGMTHRDEQSMHRRTKSPPPILCGPPMACLRWLSGTEQPVLLSSGSLCGRGGWRTPIPVIGSATGSASVDQRLDAVRDRLDAEPELRPLIEAGPAVADAGRPGDLVQARICRLVCPCRTPSRGSSASPC